MHLAAAGLCKANQLGRAFLPMPLGRGREGGAGLDMVNAVHCKSHLGICSNYGAAGDSINGRPPFLHGPVQLLGLLHLPMAGVHVQQSIVGPQHVSAYHVHCQCESRLPNLRRGTKEMGMRTYIRMQRTKCASQATKHATKMHLTMGCGSEAQGCSC